MGDTTSYGVEFGVLTAPQAAPAAPIGIVSPRWRRAFDLYISAPASLDGARVQVFTQPQSGGEGALVAEGRVREGSTRVCVVRNVGVSPRISVRIDRLDAAGLAPGERAFWSCVGHTSGLSAGASDTITGAAGTVDVVGVVKRIEARGMAGSISINDGAPIAVPGSRELTPRVDSLVNPRLVFAGTTSFVVEVYR